MKWIALSAETKCTTSCPCCISFSQPFISIDLDLPPSYNLQCGMGEIDFSTRFILLKTNRPEKIAFFIRS